MCHNKTLFTKIGSELDLDHGFRAGQLLPQKIICVGAGEDRDLTTEYRREGMLDDKHWKKKVVHTHFTESAK